MPQLVILAMDVTDDVNGWLWPVQLGIQEGYSLQHGLHIRIKLRKRLQELQRIAGDSCAFLSRGFEGHFGSSVNSDARRIKNSLKIRVVSKVDHDLS